MRHIADMEKTLPDYIREVTGLRQTLLEQEGGIMKYLAGHLDADGLEALYKGYRDQCVELFREANKWHMGEDSMKREALADDHIKKELVYQEALMAVFSKHEEMAEQAHRFIKDYMDYAFKESHRKLYSDETPAHVFYGDVIAEFGDKLFGRPHICLWRVLEKHRGTAKAEKDADDLWTEFELQKYAVAYSIGWRKLRQGIREELDERTHNKNEEERRQICRQMAKEDMKRLWQFAHLANGDYDLIELFYSKTKEGIPLTQIWSAKDLERQGVDVGEVLKKGKIYISKEEMAWLREGMLYSDSPHDTTVSEGMTPLQKCFHTYYHLMQEIGSIWTVLLQKYGIDISELEEETGYVLNKAGFFFDMSMDGRRGKICILKHKNNDDIETRRKAILEFVNRVIDLVDEGFVPVYKEMWETILNKESVKSIVYEKGKQQNTTFNRNLVANILHFMLEKGVFKAGSKPAAMSRSLDPDRGVNSPVKAQLGLPPNDKDIKKDVENVITEYSKSSNVNDERQ